MLDDERRAPEQVAADEAAQSTREAANAGEQPMAEPGEIEDGTARDPIEGAQEERRYRVFADLHAKGCGRLHPLSLPSSTVLHNVGVIAAHVLHDVGIALQVLHNFWVKVWSRLLGVPGGSSRAACGRLCPGH